jgi:Nucleotidyltransferase domain
VTDALAEYIEKLSADETAVGLLLHGSRALGLERQDSDYDLICVVSDNSYQQRKAAGALLECHRLADGCKADVLYQSPPHLRELVERPDWYTATYIKARVLLDKTGELTKLVALITDAASGAAAARVSEEYDAYLNSWVRSIKAWRRGDELGGRLHAAASVLERLQGWRPGELRAQIVALLDRGSPDVQQRLQARIEALFRSRGIEHEWATTSKSSRACSSEAAAETDDARVHEVLPLGDTRECWPRTQSGYRTVVAARCWQRARRSSAFGEMSPLAH